MGIVGIIDKVENIRNCTHGLALMITHWTCFVELF